MQRLDRPHTTRLLKALLCAATIPWLSACGGGDDTQSTTLSDGPPRSGQCADVGGGWMVHEIGSVSCSPGETENVNDTQPMVIAQNGCNIAYTRAGLPRTGVVTGRSISGSGDFAIAAPGVTLTSNKLDFSGEVAADGRTLTMQSTGVVSASAGGETQTCSGKTTATLERSYDVAVVVLRGGPITVPGSQFIPPDSALNDISAAMRGVDPARVAARVFDAGIDFQGRFQSQQAVEWLASLNRGGKRPAALVVGFSLGGHAALSLPAQPLCSRILLDPVDSSLVGAALDQHALIYRALPGVPVLHFAAEKAWVAGSAKLWGYQVSGSNVIKRVVAGSDHATIPQKLFESPVDFASVMTATRDCLANHRAK